MNRPFVTMMLLFLAATLLAALPAAASGDTIALRSAVRLPADATRVRLADIAELTGPNATKHGELVIAELSDPTAAVEIPLHDVRSKLDEAGVHWGLVSLNGRSVTVRPRRSGTVSPPMAMGTVALAAEPKAAAETPARPDHELASDLIGRRTLRGMLAAYLAKQLGVQPKDLKLSFDQRQAAFLDRSPSDTTRFEIEPISNLRSSRIDLTIRVWIDGLVDHRRTVSLTPLVRTPVVVVRKEMRRDDVIHEDSLEIEHRWLSPGQAGLVQQFEHAAGRHALVRLREGEVLRETHLRRETLVHRGEQVIVRCLVGSAVISLQAEARGDGSEGDAIEFRKLGERETFLATVTGRKEAIVDLENR